MNLSLEPSALIKLGLDGLLILTNLLLNPNGRLRPLWV